MTLIEFARQIEPIVKYFGPDHFPKIVVERMHFRAQDLSSDQMQEVINRVLDTCRYAPKVPEFVELVNGVRNRHRTAVELLSNDAEPRTPEVARESMAKILKIIDRVKVTT